MDLYLQIVVNPQGKTLDLELGESTNIGRASYNRVQIQEPYMSSKHAMITRGADGTYSIEDRNSKNGTFVNDVRVEIPTPIVAGDTLRFGLAACKLIEKASLPENPLPKGTPAPALVPLPSPAPQPAASTALVAAVAAIPHAADSYQPGFLNAIPPKSRKPDRKSKPKSQKQPFYGAKPAKKGRRLAKVYDPFN